MKKHFRWLRNFLKGQGFEVVMVPVTWNRRTMRDYAVEFEEFYSKHKSEENYILGFSYGAVIALIVGERLSPKNCFFVL